MKKTGKRTKHGVVLSAVSAIIQHSEKHSTELKNKIFTLITAKAND